MLNPIAVIRAYFTVKKTGEEIVQEANMQSIKDGWKTSEFWAHVASQVAILWGAVNGFIPAKYAAIISVAGISVYNVGRVVVKAAADIKAAQAIPAK